MFLEVINKATIYMFLKDFDNNRKKPNRAVTFSCEPFSYISNYMDNRRDLQII